VLADWIDWLRAEAAVNMAMGFTRSREIVDKVTNC
jgi:hypothetical protein